MGCGLVTRFPVGGIIIRCRDGNNSLSSWDKLKDGAYRKMDQQKEEKEYKSVEEEKEEDL